MSFKDLANKVRGGGFGKLAENYRKYGEKYNEQQSNKPTNPLYFGDFQKLQSEQQDEFNKENFNKNFNSKSNPNVERIIEERIPKSIPTNSFERPNAKDIFSNTNDNNSPFKFDTKYQYLTPDETIAYDYYKLKNGQATGKYDVMQSNMQFVAKYGKDGDRLISNAQAIGNIGNQTFEKGKSIANTGEVFLIEKNNKRINKQLRDNQAYEQGKNSPVSTGLFTVAENALASIPSLGETAINAGKQTFNEVTKSNSFKPTDYFTSEVNRNQLRREGILSNLPENKNPLLNPRTYGSIGFSIADMATTLPFGATASLYLMAGNAAGQSATQAIESGIDPKKALQYGVAMGGIEALTEKIPLENLFKIAKSGKNIFQKEVLKNVLKQAGIEAGEETLSEYSGNIADIAILGKEGQFEQYRQQLIKSGLDGGKATEQALYKFFIENPSVSALGGALSGGVLASGANTLNSINSAKGGKQFVTTAYKLSGQTKPYNEFKRDFSNLIIDTAKQAQQGILDNKYSTSEQKTQATNRIVTLENLKGTPLSESTIASIASTSENAVRNLFENKTSKFYNKPTETTNKEIIDDGGKTIDTALTPQTIETANLNPNTLKTVTFTPEQVKSQNKTNLEGIKNKISESDYNQLSDALPNVSVPVKFVDLGKTSDGKTIQGIFVGGQIILNPKSKTPLFDVYKHELTHSLQKNNDISALEKYVDRYFKAGGENLALKTAKQQQNYKNSGIELSYEDVKNEILANFVAENLFLNENSIKKLIATDINLATKIYDWIKEKITYFKVGKRPYYLLKAENIYRKLLLQKNGTVTVESVNTSNNTQQKTPKQEVVRENQSNVKENQPQINSVSNKVDKPLNKNAVGKIDYLGFRGEVVETQEFTDKKLLEETIKEKSEYGVPFSVTVYDKPLSDTLVNNINTPMQGYKVVTKNQEQGKSTDNKATENTATKTLKSDKQSVQKSTEQPSEKATENTQQYSLEDTEQQSNGNIATIDDTGRDFPLAEVMTTLDEGKLTFKEKFNNVVDKFLIAIDDAGTEINKIATANKNPKLYNLFNWAKSSFNSAIYNITTKQTDLFATKEVGVGLKQIFDPIIAKGDSYYQDFLIYMYEAHNIDRRKQGKTVTGHYVSESQNIIKKLLEKYPEFENYAQSIYNYCDNLQKIRLESGLISQEQYENLKKMYPHYVPTYRNVSKRGGETGLGTVKVNQGIGKAVGSVEKIMPLNESLAKQTVQAFSSARINLLAKELANSDTDLVVKDTTKKEIEQEYDIDEEETANIGNTPNTMILFENGKSQRYKISSNLYTALRSITTTENDYNIIEKVGERLTHAFKQLVTGKNPVFMIRNPIRDLQDAFLYTKFTDKQYAKAFARAVKEVKNNGKLWKQYQALGGFNSSIFDYNDGFRYNTKPKSTITKFTDKIEQANYIIEQMPRFAEFIATIENTDGNEKEVTLQALLNAADVTVNFSRSGTLGKRINRSYVPFFNPAVQGTSKFIRTLYATKSFKLWIKLLLRVALWGTIPVVINELLLGDDDEYKKLSEREKDDNYIFKVGKDQFIKIPKGRVLSIFSNPAQRTIRAFKDETDWGEYFKNSIGKVAPSNPFETNLYSPIISANTNTTWYGSPIEPRRLEAFKPGQRYDENTDYFSRFIGGMLNVSPKKVNYILKSYSGVVGDFLLPIITPKSNRSPFSSAFMLDSTMQNKLSEEFYNTKTKLQNESNDLNLSVKQRNIAKVNLRFYIKQTDAITDLTKQIREIENSKLSNTQKLSKTKEIRVIINGIMQNAKKVYPTYSKNVENNYNKFSRTITDKEKLIDEVYLWSNYNSFGADYALKTYNKDTYEKAKKLEKDISLDKFFVSYMAMRKIEGDKNKFTGDTIKGSTKKNKINALKNAGISNAEQVYNLIYD